MTADNLKKHLGTIAKSGTSEFAEAVKGNRTDLIGQFGVGFYSSFLVADTVTVVSKNNDDDQHIWESTSASGFKIVKDPRGNTLGRGTEIILQLRPEEYDFLEDQKLRNLISKYSEFINFPIYLYATKEVVEEPVATPESDVDEVEDVEVDTEAEGEPKISYVSEWELINTNKPIWTRNPSDISEAEYHEFYKGLFKESKDPLAYSHFNAEGDTEFSAIMFIPQSPPKGFMEGTSSDKESARNVRMFVRRVFITDLLPDFLPKWLSFMRVLVDSHDLPLSVSRDNLQNHPKIRTIRKKIIGKGLDLMLKLNEMPTDRKGMANLYDTFYIEFKSALKYGLLEGSGSSSHRISLR